MQSSGHSLRTNSGEYRVHELVAAGGYGGVYYGRDLDTNTPVAVKLLHAHHARDARVVREFEHEAQLFRGVRHPNVVQVLDQGRDDNGVPFIVMEWVTGWTVAALLERHGALPPEEAAADICQALDGLEVARQRNVIHRDIKPLNLMVTAEGVVKVMDFGIAKDQELAAVGGSSVPTGTPAYMAPEQFRAEPLDSRVDLYALGVTLYEMLTGRVPFEAPSWSGFMYQHLEAPPPPLATLRPSLSPPLVAVVDRAMAKAREQRFQTPVEMREALAPFAGSATAPTTPPPRLVTEPARTPTPLVTQPESPGPVRGTEPAPPENPPVVGGGLVSPPHVEPERPPPPPPPKVEGPGAGSSQPEPAKPASVVPYLALGAALLALMIGGIAALPRLLDGVGPNPTSPPPTSALAPTRPTAVPTLATVGPTVNPATPQVATAVVPRGSIALGQPINAEIRTAGEQHVYMFSGQVDQDVTITLDAPRSAVDPYLQLFGPDNRLLAEDDDGGEAPLDAKIDIRLPRAGTYTIVARDFSNDDTGTYTLAVSPGRFIQQGDWNFNPTVTFNSCGGPPTVGTTVPYRLRLAKKGVGENLSPGETFDLFTDGTLRGEFPLAFPRLTMLLGDERSDHVHIDITFSSSTGASTINVIDHRVSPARDCYFEWS